jgi:outer membrane protein
MIERDQIRMLKITIHHSPTTLTFQVEGKLIGAWARELEAAWNSVSSNPNEKARVVDLTETLFIDDEGKRVLTKLFREGAFFRTSGPLTDSIVADITGKRSRPWRGILTQSLLLLLVVSIAWAADPAPLRLTLRDAAQLALKQNPQVQVANLNIAVSQENQTIARSGLLPQVNLDANEVVRRANLQALFGKSIQGLPGHIGPFWVTQAGPTGSVPIFDLTAWRRWQASNENVNGARAQSTTVREENVQLVVSQYLGSLRAAADVTAARSRVDLAKALLDQATDLQQNGAGTRIDTLRANVQYQNEQQRLIDSQTQLKTSLYGLGRLLNIDPHQTVELADEPEFFQTPAYTASQTIEQAFTDRPEMKTLASEIRAQELQRKEAQEQWLPRLSLTGSWSLQGLTPTSMIPSLPAAASRLRRRPPTSS